MESKLYNPQIMSAHNLFQMGHDFLVSQSLYLGEEENLIFF